MVNIDKLLRKRKPTGAELGVLEIANYAHLWQQKKDGVEDPDPLYDRDSFQKKIDSLTGTDSAVYAEYMVIHDWLSRRNAMAYMQELTAQACAMDRLQSIMRVSAHEAVYNYIYDSPVIMTPDQYEREKANGFKGNRRAALRGVAVLKTADPAMIDGSGNYIQPAISSQGLTEPEIIANGGADSITVKNHIDDIELRIYDAYRFVYGFNVAVDMIADFLGLPSVQSLKVSMEQTDSILKNFNERVRLEKELLSLTHYDDDGLRLRKLEALEGFFGDPSVKPEELHIREEDKEKAWNLISHLHGFHGMALINLLCYDHDDDEEVEA